MKKQLKIGVIGAGRIGKLHAFNLATRVPGAKLTAVSDVDKKARKSLPPNWEFRPFTATIKAVGGSGS